MSLSQNGRDVTGVLSFRATQYDIVGTINSADRLDFANELDTVNCTLYASFRAMGLSANGGTLQGDIDRVQLDIPCTDPNPTVRSDTRDLMQLARD